MTTPARILRKIQGLDIGQDEILRRCNAREVREAERLAQSFMHRSPSHYYHIPLCWPSVVGVATQATRIGYRSDKFDKVWRDYTHEHKKPYPNIIASFIAGQMKSQPFSPGPQPAALAILGFALEVEYRKPNGKPGHHDWKGDAYLPFLCGCPKTHSLIIVPQDGGFPLVLRSRIMRIRPEGIVN